MEWKTNQHTFIMRYLLLNTQMLRFSQSSVMFQRFFSDGFWFLPNSVKSGCSLSCPHTHSFEQLVGYKMQLLFTGSNWMSLKYQLTIICHLLISLSGLETLVISLHIFTITVSSLVNQIKPVSLWDVFGPVCVTQCCNYMIWSLCQIGFNACCCSLGAWILQ